MKDTEGTEWVQFIGSVFLTFQENTLHLIKKQEFRSVEATINSVGNQMDNLASLRPTCIFYFSTLSSGVPDISRWFNVNDHAHIISWLLEEDGSIGQVCDFFSLQRV